MSTSVRVSVVTGANKGIGLAIVRSLCKQFTGDVYLTARDEGRGRAAVASLEAEGLSPKFHQLDITSQESVDALKKFILEKYGGIDVLVNNAGMCLNRIVPPVVECSRVYCESLCS
jgi:NAD(P)-dependent dehydrogenase (short-subunit alcohol dehydrogenase family)